MHHRSPLLTVMIKAASKAGRSLRRDFGEVEHLQVSKKNPGDFVSSADMNSERILFEELSKARPDFGFVMEEKGTVEGKTDTHWIIDPLDGTTNFLHGIPHFAISIAVREKDKIIAGVIYNPVYDDLYYCEKGSGAFYNQQRIRVSNRKYPQDSIIATGIPWKGRGPKEHRDRFLSELQNVMENTAGVRRFGAASLDLAYVAAGKYDGYWERGLHIWDIAAGLLMVKEAGGIVEGMTHREDPLETGNVFATNMNLYPSLVRILREGDLKREAI